MRCFTSYAPTPRFLRNRKRGALSLTSADSHLSVVYSYRPSQTNPLLCQVPLNVDIYSCRFSATIAFICRVIQRGCSTISQLLRISPVPCPEPFSMVGLIGTHNGKFHCDEVFACFMLKRLNQFRDYEIVRCG